MKTLAIDTSNGFASFALKYEEKIFFQSNNSQSNQYEDFYSILENILDQAKLTVKDLDIICVTNGPGSFTGIRIGLAAIKGLQTAAENMNLNIKFICLTNFQVLAYSARKSNFNKLKVIVHAINNQFYTQDFDCNLVELNEPQLIENSDLCLNKLKKENFAICTFNLPHLEADFDIKKIDAQSSLYAIDYFLSKNLQKDLLPLYIKKPSVNLSKK